jgi:hypothetical protein
MLRLLPGRIPGPPSHQLDTILLRTRTDSVLPTMLWYVILFVVAAILYAIAFPKGRWPDGPRGLPLIGTIPDKKSKLHEHFAKFAAQYGDVFSIQMGRKRMVVLSSPQAIDDLIVKKGGKYSSRPSQSAPAEYIGQSRLVTLRYGDTFRVRNRCPHDVEIHGCSDTSRRSIAGPSTACSACTMPRFFYRTKNTKVGKRWKDCWRILSRSTQRCHATHLVSPSVCCTAI